MTHSSVLFLARANFVGLFFIAFFWACVIMATNFLELATTLKYLGAKWLPEKKVNFTPWIITNLNLAETRKTDSGRTSG